MAGGFADWDTVFLRTYKGPAKDARRARIKVSRCPLTAPAVMSALPRPTSIAMVLVAAPFAGTLLLAWRCGALAPKRASRAMAAPVQEADALGRRVR